MQKDKIMDHQFRKATRTELPAIWEILEQGIRRRKAEGSNQWQDGYPNPEVVGRDIERGVGYVLMMDDEVAGYSAILINDEPAYFAIEGQWLSDGDFVVYHRVGVSEKLLGKGVARKMLEGIEEYARSQGIRSVRADTNHDNGPMLHLFDKLGYTYCGEVYFRGSARRAYEKLIAL